MKPPTIELSQADIERLQSKAADIYWNRLLTELADEAIYYRGYVRLRTKAEKAWFGIDPNA